MAVITIAYSRIVLAFFEVADEATAFSNGYMFSLDNLRVADRAAEPFASF